MFHCRTSFKQEIGQIKSLAPLQVEFTQTEIDGMKELSNRAFQQKGRTNNEPEMD